MWEFAISLGKDLKVENHIGFVTLTYTFAELSDQKLDSSSSVDDEIGSDQEDEIIQKFSQIANLLQGIVDQYK